MFKLFSELIAFHLQSQDVVDRSLQAVQELNKELEFSQDENRQYRYISDHNLQEPLRKLRLFSSMLISPETDPGIGKDLAEKINKNAQKFSMMIKDLSHFSKLNYLHSEVESTDLNAIVQDVVRQLSPELHDKKGTIQYDKLPVIHAVTFHMEQLFYHLITNAIEFSRGNVPPAVRIQSKPVSNIDIAQLNAERSAKDYIHITIEDNGQGIEQKELQKIFDIFYNFLPQQSLEGSGIGLAYCRKIIHLHNGLISATSTPGQGTTFSLILPVKQAAL